MATIPRGIRVIDWKNADKSRSIRYRIRVEKTNFVVDRSFADLDKAKIFLEDTKTPEGRLLIAQGRDRASTMVSAMEKAAAEVMMEGRCTLRHAVDSYRRVYVTPKITCGVDKDQRTAKSTRDRLNKCLGVKVSAIKQGFHVPTGALAGLRGLSKGHEMREIGDFYLDELTEQETTEYIRTRLASGLAKGTVKREVALLQSAVNKLRYTDNKAWKKLDEYNPFEKADKTLLKGGEKRRRRVISDEEEVALIDSLKRCRNPEMGMAFALALSTGMRRAEMLALTWAQVDVDRGVIMLDADQTKADDERMAILLPDAIAILKTIPRVDDRVFHYTIDGFKTNFKRVLERAGLTDIHMHDTRRSFISRVLKGITQSPVAIADMIGAKNIANLQKRTIDRINQNTLIESGAIKTEEELRFVVGHADGQITARYAVMAPEKKKKAEE